MKNEIIAVSVYHNIGGRNYQEDAYSDITLANGARAITVCDGLGGHWGGAEASSWIAKNLPGLLLNTPRDPGKAKVFLEQDIPNAVRESFRAHAGGGKTTLASFVWDPNKEECYFFYAGDSHILHFRPSTGNIPPFTLVKHSPIEGIRNIVYNCLSSSGSFGEIRRIGPYMPQKGDIVIVASDGIDPLISDIVEEATIGFDDIAPRNSHEFLRSLAKIKPGGDISPLFDEISKLSGSDNITAQIVWF